MGSEVVGAIVDSAAGEGVRGLVVDRIGSVVGVPVTGSTVGSNVGGATGVPPGESVGMGVI